MPSAAGQGFSYFQNITRTSSDNNKGQKGGVRDDFTSPSLSSLERLRLRAALLEGAPASAERNIPQERRAGRRSRLELPDSKDRHDRGHAAGRDEALKPSASCSPLHNGEGRVCESLESRLRRKRERADEVYEEAGPSALPSLTIDMPPLTETAPAHNGAASVGLLKRLLAKVPHAFGIGKPSPLEPVNEEEPDAVADSRTAPCGVGAVGKRARSASRSPPSGGVAHCSANSNSRGGSSRLGILLAKAGQQRRCRQEVNITDQKETLRAHTLTKEEALMNEEMPSSVEPSVLVTEPHRRKGVERVPSLEERTSTQRLNATQSIFPGLMDSANISSPSPVQLSDIRAYTRRCPGTDNAPMTHPVPEVTPTESNQPIGLTGTTPQTSHSPVEGCPGWAIPLPRSQQSREVDSLVVTGQRHASTRASVNRQSLDGTKKPGHKPTKRPITPASPRQPMAADPKAPVSASKVLSSEFLSTAPLSSHAAMRLAVQGASVASPTTPQPCEHSPMASVGSMHSNPRCIVFDTSSLLESEPPVMNLLIEKWVACIPYATVDELDKFNKCKMKDVAKMTPQLKAEREWRTRRAREIRDWIVTSLVRKDGHLRLQRRTEVVDEYDRKANSNDDSILGFAVYLKRNRENVLFVTEDKFLRIKAQGELGDAYAYKDIRAMLGVRR